jgi:hypothetical protein
MDDILQKATKNLHKCKEHLSVIRTGPETKPAVIAEATTTPTYTNHINTVEQVDTRLLEMEQHWLQTWSSPFPKKIWNAMMDLRAALVIWEEETVQHADPLQVAEKVGEIVERWERSQKKSQKKGGKVKRI